VFALLAFLAPAAAVTVGVAYHRGRGSNAVDWDRYQRMETLILGLTEPVSDLAEAHEIPVLPASYAAQAQALRAEIHEEHARIRAERRRRGF
jgi:hypothetical protein